MPDMFLIAGQLINYVARFFERFIYGCRWVIVPMYVGLIAALAVYTYKFGVSLVDLCLHYRTITEADLMIDVLSLVDTTMIGNLIVIITVGSYCIFVRPIHFDHEDTPHWLQGIDSSTLKIKTGMSLIGVSSVHLLKDFIEAATLSHQVFITHIGIHLVFLVSTISLALTGRISHPSTPPTNSHHA